MGGHEVHGRRPVARLLRLLRGCPVDRAEGPVTELPAHVRDRRAKGAGQSPAADFRYGIMHREPVFILHRDDRGLRPNRVGPRPQWPRRSEFAGSAGPQ